MDGFANYMNSDSDRKQSLNFFSKLINETSTID
jgi:hypothetical protein